MVLSGNDPRSMEKSPQISIESVQPSQNDNIDFDEEFTYAEQRKIIHRIDRRLIITTGIIYCVSLMDRSNLPNAAIAGMTLDLDLNVGFRYVSLCTLRPAEYYS
jgi:hypothetical protein